MTTSEVARRAEARLTNGGTWVARCPSHDDRRPSLSIREGRDDRVLLRCFAGCSLSAITNALGLKPSDLFPKSAREYRQVRRSRVRPPTADIVERDLQAELTRIVAEESARLGFDIAVLARHRNKARSIVECRRGISLRREPSPWYEVDPHAVDQMWLPCVDQAVSEIAATGEMTGKELWRIIEGLPETRHRALLIARQHQRSLCEALPDGYGETHE